MWLFKAAVVLTVAYLLWQTVAAIAAGMSMYREWSVEKLVRHRAATTRILWAVALAIMLIEFGERVLRKEPAIHDVYFWIHLVFATVYLLSLLAARFVWTGTRNLKVHLSLVSISLIAACIVIPIGSVQLYQMQ